MTKKFLALAAAALALTGTTFAQDIGEEGIDDIVIHGEAHVIVPLQWEWIDGRSTLDFGTLERGETMDIWAGGTGHGTPALFEISGDAGDDIQLWVPETMRLRLMPCDDPNGPAYSENDSDTYIDASLLTNGGVWKVRVEEMLAGFPNTNPGNLYEPGECVSLSADDAGEADAPGAPAAQSDDGMGQLYVSVGGIATASETQQRGHYEGDMTVMVDYCCY